MSPRSSPIAALARSRPRSRFQRVSLLALGALAVWAWTSGFLAVGDAWSARRLENLRRFVSREVVPHPLRDRDLEPGAYLAELLGWVRSVLAERGLQATLQTTLIAVLAICLAGFLAGIAAPFAARTLASPQPYLPEARPPRARVRLFWRLVCTLTRALLVLMRAVPEYVLAFLLLAVLGPNAWPAVLALAVHNAGILGRLTAESIENTEPAPVSALRGLGATRGHLTTVAVLPLTLGRFLLYFFYRFESCVREATVLGMLGVVSLGYWIQDARSKHYYDEMLLFVLLGAGIVLAADVLSSLARRAVRRAR